MTIYQKISDMWPQDRSRELYLPQEVARELSFLTLEEMAEMELLCPLRLPFRVSAGAKKCAGKNKQSCKRCQLDFLSGPVPCVEC